ncbi:sulfotransferase domain-containing protein [Algoriphagus zhangzhouensis]|uniref:Sulfotransferase domain-containing protein n=1 Tax=Algoriphagus zhangzhouensis TaxID=1073327 RepID=A0A1M7ZHY3_9BACT|nr:sulfotransferase domain-containing protein [Algoriphagus zhangzhouensis]TDY44273.1 sulfotransferase domain-containing protein [Algoriphagus zhangzhouensis]SHO64483.1 Sulfotransferase domain-containing protein [Algoriphagus zhangzhouensis]
MKEVLKPHVFHIGIPKSGSTSIQEVLENDSRLKLTRSRFFTGAEWWAKDTILKEADFPIIESNETLISGGYQKVKFSQVVARFHKTNPNADIIIVLRNQPKAIMSMYKFHIVNAFWGVKSFRNWLFHTDLGMDYLSICFYGDILKTLMAYYPKEQIKVLLFEELKKNPSSFYTKFYKSLGLEFECTEFPLQNQNSFSEGQLYTLTKLNRFAIFSRKSESRFYHRIGHRIEQRIKFSLIKIFRLTPRKDFFSWDTIPGKLKIFNEFKKTNQEIVDLGFVSKEELQANGYLLP